MNTLFPIPEVDTDVARVISPELQKFIRDRSLGRKTQTLDPVSEELFWMYMGDGNSSTVREIATVLVAGYVPLGGKRGRDAIDPVTGKKKEVKPRSFNPEKPSIAGIAWFSDYHWERYAKDMKDELDIVHSLFINGRIAYVVEFGIQAVSKRLEEHLHRHITVNGQSYVRKADWSFAHWGSHPSTRIHHVDWSVIDAHPKCIPKGMRKLFMTHSKRKEESSTLYAIGS